MVDDDELLFKINNIDLPYLLLDISGLTKSDVVLLYCYLTKLSS
jgi:hypothetical protein